MVIPVGSTEQHGPHLPLDTDTRIATAVARAVAERLPGRMVEHWLLAPGDRLRGQRRARGFPGTVSIGTEALERCSWSSAGRRATGPAGWSSSTVTVAT